MTAAGRLAIGSVGPAAPAAKLAHSITVAGAFLSALTVVFVAAVVPAVAVGACCIAAARTAAVGCLVLPPPGDCRPGRLGRRLGSAAAIKGDGGQLPRRPVRQTSEVAAFAKALTKLRKPTGSHQ